MDSPLRQGYFNDLYIKRVEIIVSKISNKNMWVFTDDKTDLQECFVANVAVSTLELDRSGFFFLIH